MNVAEINEQANQLPKASPISVTTC